MHRYRKKLVVVEAVQWTGDNWTEMRGFLGVFPFAVGTKPRIMIRTLEGCIIANPGDWIIKSANGEFYPCKPDIFEKIYERVEEDA